LPESLLESELFGYQEGAFTGAKKGGKPGKFELADGGTLFLDEIGDMPANMQAKILRVLQDREIERVGGSKPMKVDVRVITATNRDLEEMVRKKQFRADLFYRLNVVTMEIPPLRERIEDIPLLVEFFLKKLARQLGCGKKKISGDTLAVLLRHRWPGNIRELENAIEYAFILCRGGLIQPEDLPEYLRGDGAQAPIFDGLTLRDIERRAIYEALERNGWRRVATAKELGIDKNSLRRKIIRFGIEKGRDNDNKHPSR